MKRYIIAVNSVNPVADKAFITFLKATKLGWWHYINNVWLISDKKEKLESKVLRDKVVEIYSAKYCIVIEIGDDRDTWSGFGAKGMFDWLKLHWKKTLPPETSDKSSD
jgi:hypothetical protein